MKRAAFDMMDDFEVSLEYYTKQTEWCKELIDHAKAQGKSTATVETLEALSKSWEERTEKLRNEKS